MMREDDGMKKFNLSRLLDACQFSITDELHNALMDYLLEIDVDLNILNIDDLVVNYIQYADSIEDINNLEDYSILVNDDNGVYYL
jgi:hypothetical protein